MTMSGAQVAANAKAMVGQTGWYRQCLAAVNKAWGKTVSWLGAPTAYQAWLAAPASEKHSMSEAPTIGASIFFASGSPAGHVVTYVGNGMVVSNDIRRNGVLSEVPLTDITNGTWHLRALGWTNPDHSATADGKAASAPSTSTSTSSGGSVTGDLAAVGGALTTLTSPKTWTRVGEVILALLVIGVGAAMMIGGMS